jgi:P2-related tail formation protein
MIKNQIIDTLLGSSPRSDDSLTLLDPPGKKVIVHYWEDYNAGKHIFFELEVGTEYTIQDLVMHMITNIDKTIGKKRNQSSFVVRVANKQGFPKTDIPVMDKKQKVQNVTFVRFTICDKNLDQKAKIHVEQLSVLENPSANTESPKSNSLCRKLNCCIVV